MTEPRGPTYLQVRANTTSTVSYVDVAVINQLNIRPIFYTRSVIKASPGNIFIEYHKSYQCKSQNESPHKPNVSSYNRSYNILRKVIPHFLCIFLQHVQQHVSVSAHNMHTVFSELTFVFTGNNLAKVNLDRFRKRSWVWVEITLEVASLKYRSFTRSKLAGLLGESLVFFDPPIHADFLPMWCLSLYFLRYLNMK